VEREKKELNCDEDCPCQSKSHLQGFGVCDDDLDFEVEFESIFLFVFSSVMEVGRPA
jgi:hypothetical protein